MGMMIRRNIKQRAAKKVAPVNVYAQEKQQVKTVTPVENEYTKTDINRMTTSYLQELATKEGIDGAEDMTGSELKKLLIEKFGL